jgi:CDP-glucose 4,6-dehydratase
LGQRRSALENLVMPVDLSAFYRGKRVFVTGHTGFKGGWLTIWLTMMGAEVTGFSLEPDTSPNLFETTGVASGVRSIIGDIRDLAALREAVAAAQPEIVFHLAAQPLVRRSYREPVETYATNVMGTVHLLESARAMPSVRAALVVTSDKCYDNREWIWGYREQDALGGRDPYSSSKACAELVVSAYRHSYCSTSSSDLLIASARAGNVIGGGDWSEDRLVPDTVRAVSSNQPVVLHHPNSVRPWQHVLEPLWGYLLLAARLSSGERSLAEAWNFGPPPGTEARVEDLVRMVLQCWGSGEMVAEADPKGPHEAGQLRLDSTKSNLRLCWKPRLNLSQAVALTVESYRNFLESPKNARQIIERQIRDYTGVRNGDDS